MDKITYRMSSAGYCPRKLSAIQLDKESSPAPVWLELTANEGNWHEERLKQELADEKQFVFDEQLEVTLEFAHFILVGHIDGKTQDLDHQREPILLEIKSMSQFEFDRWMRYGFEAFPNYKAQINCYLEATGLNEALYIVKNRNSGYIDRHTVQPNRLALSEVIDKLAEVTKWVNKGELYPSRWPGIEEQALIETFDPTNIECRRCAYKSLCIPEAKELTPLQKAGLDSAVGEWRQGKLLTEKGQALINTAKKAFEEHTKATGVPKWRHSGLAIQLVHYGGYETYPKAKLLKVFSREQLEPASEIKEAYDQLRITDLEAREEDAGNQREVS